MSSTTTEPTPRPYRGPLHNSRNNPDDIIKSLEAEREAQATAVPGQPTPTVEDVTEAPELVEPAHGAEEESWKKRYADLRRFLSAKEKETASKLEAMEAQLREATKKAIQLPTSQEEIDKWVEAYPDVAKIVEAIAIKKADERASQVEEKVKAAEKKLAEAARKEALVELRKAHSDFDALNNAPEFHDWVGKQTKMIQWAIYTSPNWQDCANAITLFKAQTGWGKAAEEPAKRGPGRPRKEEASAAQEVRVPSSRNEPDPQGNPRTRRWKESEIEKLKPYEFERAHDDIMAARREGRIDYDLSGGAR